MTSTFLGKWRIYVPPYLTADAGYAGYNPGTTGFAVSSDTPGKAQNIAFILRSDGQLCFLLNNDQYVGGKNELFLFLPFVSTLDQATPFAFPGFDPPEPSGIIHHQDSSGDRFLYGQPHGSAHRQ